MEKLNLLLNQIKLNKDLLDFFKDNLGKPKPQKFIFGKYP